MPKMSINPSLFPEVGTCAATILLAIALTPQLLLTCYADACAANILTILSAIAQAQFKYCRLGMIAFLSNVIKVKKKKKKNIYEGHRRSQDF